MKSPCADCEALIEQLGDALNRAGYIASTDFPRHYADHVTAIADASAAYHEWRRQNRDV